MAIDTATHRLGQSGLELDVQQEKLPSEVGNGYTQESNNTVPKGTSIINNSHQADNTLLYSKDSRSDQHAQVNSQSHVTKQSPNSSNTNYCYRHRPESVCKRNADESTMRFLRSRLEKLPSGDQESISRVWSLFSAAPAIHRNLMLQGILAQCCFPQLSYLSATVRDLIRIDFLSALPCEISIKILCFLDTTSLCKSAQVSRKWRKMADDDVVWHRMCEQHIDRKCTQCGWGLPLLERNMLRNWKRQQHLCASDSGDIKESLITSPISEDNRLMTTTLHEKIPSKRSASELLPDEIEKQSESKKRQLDPLSRLQLRPWKCVYKDRFQVGSNWKYGRCSTKIFRGHSNGVTCLQFEDNILATGSYDLTIKIWDVDSEKCIRTLRGHTSGIRALQLDNQKLISGSLDKTIRVWNWRTGECINAYMAHTAGVIALNFAGNILASGSMDNTVKVWNFEDKSVFLLQGHTDWVNAVRVDASSRTLFSASDDRTIRLWDLDTHQLIQVFEGHVGQVQQVILLSDEHGFHDVSTSIIHDDSTSTDFMSEADYGISNQMANIYTTWPSKRPKPPQYMLSGALDSTVRLWDVATGRCLKTLFGHEEGIWALAGDRLRVVTGAEDRMVKVWDIRTGKCEKTFSGHTGPVTCIGLSDSRMCSGSEDCEVRLYNFKNEVVTAKNTCPSSGTSD